MKAEETDEKKASVFFMKSFFEILHLENAMTKEHVNYQEYTVEQKEKVDRGKIPIQQLSALRKIVGIPSSQL